MSHVTTVSGSPEVDRGAPSRRIAFVGEAGVGKTTVASLVARQITERTALRVIGEGARTVQERTETPDTGLGVRWTIDDCRAGPVALDDRAAEVDAAFVVVTPETIDEIETYERRVTGHDIDLFLITNRFDTAARDRLRSRESPPVAERIPYRSALQTADIADEAVSIPDRTVEAVAIEALQPERLSASQALEALSQGDRSIVNVEVDTESEIQPLIERFERAGHRAARFDCNCQCHDGHVLARRCLH